MSRVVPLQSGRAASPRRRAAVPRLLLWVPLVIIVASLAVLALTLAHYRSRAISTGQTVVTSFAKLAEEHTGGTLQALIRAVEATEGQLAETRTHRRSALTAADMNLQLTGRPFIRFMRVLDAAGRVVHSTDGSNGLDLSAEAYFQQYRDDADAGLKLSAPARIQASGSDGPDAWYLPATYPWRAADGTLLGVIVAGIEPSYFDRVWTLEDGAAIALFRKDGLLLARAPFDASLMAHPQLGGIPIFRALETNPSGTLGAKSVLNGQQRLISYRQLKAFPDYVIVVTTTIDEVLSEWYQYSLIIFVGWLSASMVLAGLCAWLSRVWRHREENEARYRLIFDANPCPMWVYDRKTLRFLAVNEATVERYGWSREEFRAMNLTDIRRPEDLPGLHAALANEAAGTKRAVSHLKHRTRNGVLLDVEITAQTIDFGGRSAAVVVANDVTEKLKAENQLRQAQKMEAVGQMTGGIAHDFNNILAIILMKMEVLEDELPADSAYLGYVKGTIAAAIRGAGLVRRLLSFSRSRELKAVETDIAALLTNFKPLLAAAVPQLDLSIRADDDLSPCMVDRTGLETAILNLAVNARDAMRGRGVLRIAARNRAILEQDIAACPGLTVGDWLEIAVSDTGTGMSADVQAKVFEPFFTTKTEGLGTGLGLSMVNGFISQSGGIATIDSKLGRGTTITLYLPAMAAHPVAGPQDSPDKVVTFPARSRRDSVTPPARAA